MTTDTKQLTLSGLAARAIDILLETGECDWVRAMREGESLESVFEAVVRKGKEVLRLLRDVVEEGGA